jgi:hypothetical protein
MSTTRQAQIDAILRRLSFGAVPIGGFYWLDPKVVAEVHRRKVAAAKGELAAVESAEAESTQVTAAQAAAAQEIRHELSSL